MNATTKVAAAVAAGYLLGRTKKLKLAITVGTVLTGGRLAGNVRPGTLIKSLGENPEVQRLQNQLRGQVMAAAKSAAANVTSSRLEALNESLQGRGRGNDDEAEQEEPEPEEEVEEKPRSRSRSRSGSGSGSPKRSADKQSTGSAKRPARKKTASRSGGR